MAEDCRHLLEVWPGDDMRTGGSLTWGDEKLGRLIAGLRELAIEARLGREALLNTEESEPLTKDLILRARPPSKDVDMRQRKPTQERLSGAKLLCKRVLCAKGEKSHEL